MFAIFGRWPSDRSGAGGSGISSPVFTEEFPGAESVSLAVDALAGQACEDQKLFPQNAGINKLVAQWL